MTRAPRTGSTIGPLAETRHARFAVADATGARPSVLRGWIRRGPGTPVIRTCKKVRDKDMAFDTRQNEHILSGDPPHLEAQLIAKIERRG